MTGKSTDRPKPVMFYMGRPLTDYSREELIKIATEGWSCYHDAIESSRRAMKLMADLHNAAKGIKR